MINVVETQLNKWAKNGLKSTPYGAIHDVVAAGDIEKAILGSDIERLADADVQREAKKIWPSIHVKDKSKGGWFWTAVRNEVERVCPDSAVSAPHWRGFKDTMLVKDQVRISTKYVAETVKNIIQSLPR